MPTEKNRERLVGRRVGELILRKQIGIGAYGEVYLADDDRFNELYAVKCLSKVGLDEVQLRKQRHEIDIFSQLVRHRNIIMLENVVETEDTLFLIFEYAEGGDLFNAISESGKFELPVALRIASELVEAVERCHRDGIYHRDIKPENILLSGDRTLKLADFGLATTSAESTDKECGSGPYMAPEVLASAGSYSTEFADIWSIGVVLFNMITAKNPWKRAMFDEPTFAEFMEDRASFQFRFSLSSELMALFGRIFTQNPKKRCRLTELRCLLSDLALHTASSKPLDVPSLEALKLSDMESAIVEPSCQAACRTEATVRMNSPVMRVLDSSRLRSQLVNQTSNDLFVFSLWNI